jgi:hypothetical protein
MSETTVGTFNLPPTAVAENSTGSAPVFQDRAPDGQLRGMKSLDIDSSKIELRLQSDLSLNEPETNRTGQAPKQVETDREELPDGTQIELIEDPEDPSKTRLAVFKDGKVRYTNRFEYEDRIFVAIPRSNHLIRHLQLPRGIERCVSMCGIARDASSILSRCLDLDPDDINLLACFVVSTWFVERLPVAPYVALVGLRSSGKSTALAVLNLLCRRSLLTADISSAAFYRACDRFKPTLLIDEASTIPQRELPHLLRAGTTRDVVTFRKEESFKSFGPKVLSWIKMPNDAALISRCVVISLHETLRTDLLRPTSPEIRQAADHLQRQLLRARFEKMKTLTLKFDCNGEVHSRCRDLYEALMLPFADAGSSVFLLRYLKRQEYFHREPLSLVQSALLRILFRLVHQIANETGYLVGDLAAEVNADLQGSGEGFQVTARGIGAALKTLGFKSKRRNSGFTVLISRHEVKKIHDMMAAYGVDRTALISEAVGGACSFCKASGI